MWSGIWTFRYGPKYEKRQFYIHRPVYFLEYGLIPVPALSVTHVINRFVRTPATFSWGRRRTTCRTASPRIASRLGIATTCG